MDMDIIYLWWRNLSIMDTWYEWMNGYEMYSIWGRIWQDEKVRHWYDRFKNPQLDHAHLEASTKQVILPGVGCCWRSVLLDAGEGIAEHSKGGQETSLKEQLRDLQWAQLGIYWLIKRDWMDSRWQFPNIPNILGIFGYYNPRSTHQATGGVG